MQSFTLESVIASPLIRFIFSFFIPFGILSLSYFAAQITSKEKRAILVPFYFFTTYAVLSSFAFISSLLYRVPYDIIRYLSFFIVGSGVISLPYFITVLPFRSYITWFKRQTLYTKFDITIIGLIIVGLGLVALGPASDPDSLDYNLGIPLRVLESGHLTHYPFWLAAPLTSIGDYINLIGLINGTDCLSAISQYFSLLLLIYTFLSLSSKRCGSDSLLYTKLILSPFVLIFLISSQKSQMLGVSALVIAYFMMVEDVSYKYYLPLIFYSFSIKYSFYISGGIFLLIAFYLSQEKKMFALLSLFLYSLFVLPLHLYNYQYYGSPLAPFLSSLMPEDFAFVSNKLVIFLKNYNEGLAFPVGLFIPKSPSLITTIIGGSPFVALFIKYKKIPIKIYLPFCFALIASLFLTQSTSRFFLPHFLIFIFITTFFVKKMSIRYFNFALTLQALSFLVVTLVGVYTLFPGALSSDHRKETLHNHSYQYSAQRWLDTVLDEDAFIISDFRTTVWLPRKFLTKSIHFYLNKNQHYLTSYLKKQNQTNPSQQWFFVTERNIKGIAMYPFVDIEPIQSKEFFSSTRNPLNLRKNKNTVTIYKINKEKLLNNKMGSL